MTEAIWQAALELARPEMRGKRIRLLGVAASAFGAREQLGLFEIEDARRRKAIEAADELRERFGTRAVTRARCCGRACPPLRARLGARWSTARTSPRT